MYTNGIGEGNSKSSEYNKLEKGGGGLMMKMYTV
jgi:hypothetical protein